MFSKLCLVTLLMCLPRGLQAGPSSIVTLNDQEIDNSVAETPSDTHCKEYSRLVFQDGNDTCKITKNTTETAFALLGEIPHMVMISSTHLPFRGGTLDQVCGGVLISENYVLTTGSCGYIVQMLHEEGDVFIRLGEVQIDLQDEARITDSSIQVIKIAKTILHPEFNINKEDSTYNIALIQLAQPAQFNAYARPACLRRSEKLDGIPLIVSEWKRGGKEHVLRKSKSKAVTYEECKFKLSREERTAETDICVDRESDILCGDDGGAVLQTISSEPYCSYHIVGFSGIVQCWAENEAQKISFTRLAQFIPWIEGVVWP